MEIKNKATKIDLFSLKTPQMKAFHMSWFSFFLCFFAWFGIAPLMIKVEEELGLTKEQIGNTVIASVAITILARLVIGWLCDRIGPRLSYTGLLMVGAIAFFFWCTLRALSTAPLVPDGDRHLAESLHYHC